MPDAFGQPLPGEGADARDAPPPPPRNDMTPGVPPQPILNTPWKKTGATEHGPAEAYDTSDPSQGTVLGRIWGAAKEGYANAPSLGTEPGNTSILSTSTQDAINRNLGPVAGPVANFVPRVIGTAIGDVGGAMSGVGQAAHELLRSLGVSPQFQRDIPGLIAAVGGPDATALSAIANRIPKPPATYTTAYNTGLAPDALAEAKARAAARPGPGLLGDTTATIPPASSTSIPMPGAATPATSAEMKPVSQFLYKKAQNDPAAHLSPDSANAFVDNVSAQAQPAGPGTAAIRGGGDPVDAMATRLQALRDKPLAIGDVIGMDEELNAGIGANRVSNPALADKYGNMRDALRNQIDSATQDNLNGGADGWRAFSDARDAWAQYRKMQQLEDIRDSSLGMPGNPTTTMKARITKWIEDPKLNRGLTDTDKEALRGAGESGMVSEALRSFGGRLMAQTSGPAIGAALGTMIPIPVVGPWLGAKAGQLGETITSDLTRRVALNRQLGSVKDALTALGKPIQVPPGMQWPPQQP